MKLVLAALLFFPLLVHACQHQVIDSVSSISAKSYIVTDMNGHVLSERNSNERRAIASITKLFTAERNISLPLDQPIKITREDVKNGRMRSTPLVVGRMYSRKQLLALALVASDNVAANALGRSSSVELVLPSDTTFIDASGLNQGDESTAHSLADTARSLYKILGPLTIQSSVLIGNKLRRSTNPLLDKPGWIFLLSKTGFTNPAGGCLLVVLWIKDRLVTVALLGASNVRQRWCDLASIRTSLGDTGFSMPACAAARHKGVYKRLG